MRKTAILKYLHLPCAGKRNNAVLRNIVCPVAVFFLPAILFLQLPTSAQNLENAHKTAPRMHIGFYIHSLYQADLKDVKAATDLWILEVGEKAGLKTKAFVYKDVQSLMDDFKAGNLDLIQISSLKFLTLFEDFDVEPAYAGKINGKLKRNYAVVINKDFKYNDLADLEDATLAIADNDDIGLLYLNALLLEKNLPEAPCFFSKIKKMNSFQKAVLSVFFKQCDVCITYVDLFNTMSELNPQIKNKLRIIASSPPLLPMVSFYTKECDEAAKEITFDQVRNLSGTSYGRQIMAIFKSEEIVRLKDSDLDSLRETLEIYRRHSVNNIE